MKNASFDSLKLYTRDVYAEITSIVHRRGWESFVFDQITDFHFGRYLEILAHCAVGFAHCIAKSLSIETATNRCSAYNVR